jgi:hypothetical protein
MAAGSTYTPIATTTLGSAAASYTFSSIPSTYTDLVLVMNTLFNGSDGFISLQFNGDTGTNYSTTSLGGNGSSAYSGRRTSADQFYVMYGGRGDSTSPSSYIINIQNYANTTTHKTQLARSNNFGTGEVATEGNLWRSFSAINSIKLNAPSSAFNTGSTFTLYGIQAA